MTRPVRVRSPPPFTLPTAHGIHILRWPPGLGKTYCAQQAIALAFKSGARRRVIFAVSSTLKSTSLGRQVERDFRRLLDPEVRPDLQPINFRVSVVLGEGHGLSEDEYRAQFVWADEPEVKIVHYFHLPLIFGGHWLMGGLQPELLVIDELPLGGLVHSQKFTLKDLKAIAADSGIAARLVDVLHSPPVPTIREPTDVRNVAWRRSLTGAQLRQAIGNEWTDRDWRRFARGLKSRRKHLSDEWVTAFRDDLTDSESDSFRFGCRWREDRDGTVRPVGLYGNVVLSLKNLPPTLILDAYAERSVYVALFPGHTVHPIKSVKTAKPLKIEALAALRLDTLDLKDPALDQKYLQICEEVVALHLQHPVTLITTLGVQPLILPHLQKAADNLGCATLPALLHHHAGRGLNDFQGTTIVMLMEPHLAHDHLVGTMAALFPSDAAQRERTHRQLEQAEALQLLHRGRQAEHGARIIVAADPNSPPCFPDGECEFQAYEPIHRFVPGSPNPRLRDALRVVASEMEQALGGVFRSFLAVLKLVQLEGGQDSLNRHQQLLRKVLAERSLPPDSELAHWLQHDQFRRFAGVEPWCGRVDVVTPELASLGSRPLSSSRVLSGKVAGKPTRTRVWVRPGVCEQQVFNSIYR